MTEALPQRVHLVGIGGVHMSAIAQILLAWGHQVSGSDLRLSSFAERAGAAGATVYFGHAASQVGDAQLVAVTSAAPDDNPEVMEARRRAIPVIKRAEMAARLAAGRLVIAIAGAHGKTTTTSLIAWALRQAGLDPTYLIGGQSPSLGGNAAAGSGSHIVIEADEYDRAFLHYRSDIAVVTNIEPDHLDCYGDFDHLVDAFRQFLDRVPDDGLIIAGIDSPVLLAMLGRLRTRARIETYSLYSTTADWTAADVMPNRDGGSNFTILRFGKPYQGLAIGLPGPHNVSNSLAAVAVAHALSIPTAVVASALAEFKGVDRRFQWLGEAGNVTIIDDYAHHPTEVRATLAAAQARFPDRRLVCLFQPHTYSRSLYLLDGFRTCFEEAGLLLITDTYAAREEPSAGIDARQLAAAIERPPTRYAGSLEQAAQAALAELRPGDLFFTIGAGDVDRVGRIVLEALRGSG